MAKVVLTGAQAHRLLLGVLDALAVLAVLATAALQGCAVQPHWPHVAPVPPLESCPATPGVPASRSTPQMGEGKPYTLHFVEFDDQGWAFPDTAPAGEEGWTPSRQIDCAIEDIHRKLKGGKKKVITLVYVHGWKHSAAGGDDEVRHFKEVLASRTDLFKDRDVVGIYVGWQGKTLDVLGLRNLTFWSRKNAAEHVAQGRVRELFSRIRGLRSRWNKAPDTEPDAKEKDCDWNHSGEDRCPLRTVMIGHSFGGLILFNSAAPYLLETMNMQRDRLPGEVRAGLGRARSMADLIVLLNPALEGSHYDAVFEASQKYQPLENEPPLLVSITSTADWATKNAFPVARWFSSVLQYPSTSEDQSMAMRRTPGHIERFLTHKLCIGDKACADGPDGASDIADPRVKWGEGRHYCRGLQLRPYVGPGRAPQPVVWNVRTHGELIPDHSDIYHPLLFHFVERTYNDITATESVDCEAWRAPAVAAAR